MNSKGKGLLALAGLAAGAYAYWKYRNLSVEEKQQLKSRVQDTGRKIKNTVGDVESSISEKYESLKNKAQKEYNSPNSL